LTPERWAQIEELFHRSAECAPEHRSVLLDEACQDDSELRREVEALLSCDAGAGSSVQAAVQGGLDAVGFPLTGEIVSHYHILDGLGGGGMGLVYRAEDIKLGRRVALKFLPEDSAKDPAALGRFEREARSASALEHPNICPIYEFGEHEGQPFLAMQLLEGQTLRELIAAAGPGKPPLELRTLLDLAIQILEGLDAAHHKGIIHRDVKPANIFVTSEGHAKILDFGLAKLSLSGSAEVDEAIQDFRGDRNSNEPKLEADSLTSSSPFLSRTGVAMGTAGYMSPEQIRGEKLDARSDLFSFGLVLYEMATGKRAFRGDTGPDLQKATLTQMPSPARTLNPQVSAKLARIVHRALEKNCEERYQSASELRADLENLKREFEPGSLLRGRVMGGAGVVVALIASAGIWFAKRQPQPTGSLPDIKLRQLTTNSSENRVTSGAISPDGKYLAYIDQLGMHLKLIQTAETRTIPQPDEIKSASFEWELGTGNWWFPNSAKFLAILKPRGMDDNDVNSLNSSIWVVSVLGGPPHKLRDTAVLDNISPDGTFVAFETNHGRLGDREIWTMQPDGSQARKVFEIDENGQIGGLSWSPDGQHVVYLKTELKDKSVPPRWQDGYPSFHVPVDDFTQTMVTGDLKGGPVRTLVLPFDLKAANDILWSRDGRLIFQQAEGGLNSATCNLWQVPLDQQTGEFIGKPQRITDFPALCATNFSETSDSRHLAFLASKNHASIYVADLQAGGTRINNPTRLTLDEGWNNPSTWSADGKVFFFYSNRNGKETLFKQALGQDNAEPVVAQTEYESLPGGASVSPDGLWLYYGPVKQSPSEPEALMRVSANGGSPQVVLTGGIYGGPSCARSPSTVCAVAERDADRKRLVFTAFDAVNGRGRILAEFVAEATASYQWNISPDGTRIALLGPDRGRIHILSLGGYPPQTITVNGWKGLDAVTWAADGKSLFLSSSKDQVPVVLRVDMQGDARVLWEVPGGTSTYAVPSPDGRHLAMQKMTTDGNMWMMENF
jgi:serine/threonine protein kinase/dipeptidyl aminopeptidase/acylaminoacyl peptidase